MKRRDQLLEFVLREWLLLAAGLGCALSSMYARRLPVYSLDELQVLLLLFALFLVVNGIGHGGLILRLSQSVERGRFIPLKLVLVTFFLSMLITNDVALVVMVPLTLAVRADRKDVIVILEALAANAGSALTPIGNPQNLFIYWSYDLAPVEFVTAIAPFTIVFLVLLVVASLALKTQNGRQHADSTQTVARTSYFYGALFVIILLAVLRVLPVSMVLVIVLYVLVFDRKNLRVDYILLVSFFFFFGLADNMKVIFAARLQHPQHVFLLSAFASQVMSNVPATLLLANFTRQWDALLWGASAGGFGSLFGSLANLIAYRIYVTHPDTENAGRFATKFLLAGYAAFLVSIGLYYAVLLAKG